MAAFSPSAQAPAGAVNEVLGTLTVKGFGTLFTNQLGGAGGLGTGSMTFGTLGRTDNFSTLYVGGAVAAGPSVAGTSIQVLFGGSGPPLSGGGSGQAIGIVPWIGGDSNPAGAPNGLASTLYSYDVTNGLFPLDTSSTKHNQVAAGGSFNGLTPRRTQEQRDLWQSCPSQQQCDDPSLAQNGSPGNASASTIWAPAR